MGAKVTISFEGIDTVISNLDAIGKKTEQNIQDITEKLAVDTQDAWQAATPRRTGRLQEADKAKTGHFSFTLENPTYYYDWRDLGHMTPRGWRTKHGYRPAKHRSHVEGAFMTEKAVEYVEAEILDRLGKAVSD